jgi:coatomer subunit beta'
VDLHPTEPWILASLYNGSVTVWNYEVNAIVKTFEVSELPVRAARFIARKSWLIAGGDEMHIKVYNYNTFEKVTQFEAHNDYIRSISIHPTQSLLLTSADDLLIKLWDWDKGWKNMMTFEGHTHFVMQVVFNPKDSNTFASASLDCSVKVWNLTSGTPNFTLQGHEKGVNCLDYYHGGDKPYLISGADDQKVKIWDYQNKTCVATLEGHTQNVMVTVFHPELPVILTGAEDGTIKIWNAATNRLENSLNYGMERVWSLAYQRGSNNVAIGFDEGCVVVKMGREEPAITMDSTGKVIWARHNEILTTNLKQGNMEDGVSGTIKNGERLSISMKDLGACEVYPQGLAHSPNGRFVVVTGDGEYIVYTALAWRNKSYGSALEVAWSPSNEYAVRESNSRVKLFDKQFKERATQLNVNYAADAIFSGFLLAVRSSAGFITFYDWETTKVVRRIEAAARAVYWNDSCDMVALVCDESTFMLRFKPEAWSQLAPMANDEGVEAAFDLLHEINDAVKTGTWVGDCFVYTTSNNRLNYVVGGNVFTLTNFDSPMYLLGYLVNDHCIYYCDKEVNFYAWSLPVAVIDYQTAILRGDLEGAASLLPSIPSNEKDKLARFLETQGLISLAIQVTDDPEHRFDLAIQSNELDPAFAIAKGANEPAKWKRLGDAALQRWRFDLAKESLERAGDLEGLLLLHLAVGNAKGVASIAEEAKKLGKHNLAFTASWVSGDAAAASEVLKTTKREPENAILARTYLPSAVPENLQAWRSALPPRVAGTIADISIPEEWKVAEQERNGRRQSPKNYLHEYAALDRSLLDGTFILNRCRLLEV